MYIQYYKRKAIHIICNLKKKCLQYKYSTYFNRKDAFKQAELVKIFKMSLKEKKPNIHFFSQNLIHMSGV